MEASSYISYLTGLAITWTGLLIWFYSPLKVTLGQLFIDKNLYIIDQVETAVMIKNKWIGKLISCYICCSWWLSLAVSLMLKFVNDLSWKFVFTAWLTYPSLSYLYKRVIDNKK